MIGDKKTSQAELNNVTNIDIWVMCQWCPIAAESHLSYKGTNIKKVGIADVLNAGAQADIGEPITDYDYRILISVNNLRKSSRMRDYVDKELAKSNVEFEWW
ncbi:hypothetical protein [Liquorilactobacillus hordei]|uniref:hypothetical protein n=1 Tax=Liquorilactobacillus hordei TaxID=468911 RepID=UPI0039EA83B0